MTSRILLTRRLPRALCAIALSLWISLASKSQEISLGRPDSNFPGFTSGAELIEADGFGFYSPAPVNVSQGFSFAPTQLAGDRPEYPGGNSLPPPAQSGATPIPSILSEPLMVDWNLIEASPGDDLRYENIEVAKPIQIIAEPTSATVGCTTCGSARLHSHQLSSGERFASGIFSALCPCDDCYQPKWDLQQSTAFWIDSARPQTRTRFGWDYGNSMMLADRAEYFWARVGGFGPPHPVAPGVAPLIVPQFDYHELSMYTEVGKGGFSFFTTLPYRSLYLDEFGHQAGFADMRIGTKSLVHDSRLLQIAFQMTTHIPSGVARKGLGTQHVSLEPALLFGLRLSRYNFLQAQVAQWIPIAGDHDYAGALARWGVSWNHLAWSYDAGTQMTTSLEAFGWSFQDGAYTDPILGQQRANDETYVYIGPGCRLLFCNKWEFGVGGAFALTERHFAQSLIRSELTMRF